MPSKKKKYNARFPAGRIKKIMQTDEEVGKVAQAVPVMISRTLELFVESLMTKSMQITQARCAKTLTPSHMKQCISSESRFDFLKDLVKNIPDPSAQEDNENNAKDGLDYPFGGRNAPEPQSARANDSNRSELLANFYTEQGPSATVPNNRTPVIQYGPSVAQLEQPTLSFSIDNLVKKEAARSPHRTSSPSGPVPAIKIEYDNVPPLVPISQPVSMYSGQAASGDNNLLIDEDYDN